MTGAAGTVSVRTFFPAFNSESSKGHLSSASSRGPHRMNCAGIREGLSVPTGASAASRTMAAVEVLFKSMPCNALPSSIEPRFLTQDVTNKVHQFGV
jgi:hypothetical protein